MTYEQFLHDAAECQPSKGLLIRDPERKKFARKASREGYGMEITSPIHVFIMDDDKRDLILRDHPLPPAGEG